MHSQNLIEFDELVSTNRKCDMSYAMDLFMAIRLGRETCCGLILLQKESVEK